MDQHIPDTRLPELKGDNVPVECHSYLKFVSQGEEGVEVPGVVSVGVIGLVDTPEVQCKVSSADVVA